MGYGLTKHDMYPKAPKYLQWFTKCILSIVHLNWLVDTHWQHWSCKRYNHDDVTTWYENNVYISGNYIHDSFKYKVINNNYLNVTQILSTQVL